MAEHVTARSVWTYDRISWERLEPRVGGVDQLVTRERKAGPFGMAEKLVVPMKPGNAGLGKELQLKADARGDDRKGEWR